MNTVCSQASGTRQDPAPGGPLKREDGPTQTAGRVRRPNHWIYLDRWWAKRLGVTRTAGLYRIRSRDLARRLSQEALAVDASGTVLAWNGTGTQLTDLHRAASG
jgi:hypothetical protein